MESPLEDSPEPQEDGNMTDPVRLTAPNVYKDYAVRSGSSFFYANLWLLKDDEILAGICRLNDNLLFKRGPVRYLFRLDSRRSFDDAQSRLKCRKLLGIGGKEPSKVLQVLGSHESYFISIPRGYDSWQIVVPVFLLIVSILLLVFPSQCLRAMGDSGSSNSVASVLCCRLLASALIGVAGISWGDKPTTIQSIKRVLILQYTYCGAASVLFALTCFFNTTKPLLALTVVHVVVALVSLFYFVAIRQLNKPTPEKPNPKVNSDENHVN